MASSTTIIEAIEAGDGDFMDTNFFNPNIQHIVDNSQFQRIRFCVRSSTNSLDTVKREFIFSSIQRLRAIWSHLCINRDTGAGGIPVIDILLSNSSRDFNGLTGDILELRRLFWHPHSALIIGGLDGMTTYFFGFLEFLNSVEHKFPVEIFVIEHGDLLLQTSSLELQYTLQEQANEMLQGLQLSYPSLVPPYLQHLLLHYQRLLLHH